jgi:hypothetical protein
MCVPISTMAMTRIAVGASHLGNNPLQGEIETN